MKKIVLLYFICFISLSVFSQKVLLDVIENYYPVNPYTSEFSVFLKDLINNPFFKEKNMYKRTDSTLFYFKAEYIIQSPFTFKSAHIDVILAEAEMRSSDSLTSTDTILVYQLIGYTDDNLQAVKSEFTRFEREYGKRFYNSTTSDIVTGGKIEGGTRNYFLDISQISPLSVSWGKMSNNQNACIITSRFIVKGNEALMPYFVPPK